MDALHISEVHLAQTFCVLDGSAREAERQVECIFTAGEIRRMYRSEGVDVLIERAEELI